MAQVPINYFTRVTKPLLTTSTQVYSAPADTAAIMLTILATNTLSSTQTVTLGVSGLGSLFVGTQPYYNLVQSFPVPANDAANLAVGKIVLNQFDALYGYCSSASGVNLTLAVLETLNTQLE
jgi:hypothetical protein